MQISNGVKNFFYFLKAKSYQLFLLLFLLLPKIVLAGTGSTGNTSGSQSTGQTSGDITIRNPLGVDTIEAVLNKVINFMLTLAGPIAVAMIVYAGYLFMVAVDDQKKVEKARKIIFYTVIGIGVLVLSKAIVSVAINIFTASPTAPNNHN